MSTDPIVIVASTARRYGLKRGVATLCIGGGEAVAMSIECA